jgi:WD40 repeat protein
LEKVIEDAGYAAQQPFEARVLTALRVGRLEDLAQAGGEVVQPLLAACRNGDAEIAARARRALRQLERPEAREALWQAFLHQDDPVAAEAVIEGGYEPRQPTQRVLFYFLTAQWRKYDELDVQGQMLRAIYETAGEGLRQRIMAQARAAGRLEGVEAICGGRQARRLGQMTDAEWEAVVEVLSVREQWEEMWRLAQRAPPVRSVQLTRRLDANGWEPVERERAGFQELKLLARWWRSPNLSRLIRPLATLEGHGGGINGLAISPDRRLLATGSWDRTVRLWSLSEGRCVAMLKGHSRSVGCLAISPDGRLLASGGFDKTVRLWSLLEGRPLAKLKGHTHSVRCLAISPDGRFLGSGSADATVRLWSLPEGRHLATLEGHSAWVNGLAISPDGRLLASGSWDKTVRLWNLPEGRHLATLKGHTGPVGCLAISPDGQLLASGSWDKTVRLWGLAEGRHLATLEGHTHRVNCLAINQDGFLASGSDDGTVGFWSLPEGRHLATLEGHTDQVWCLAISLDRSLLASGSLDGTVRLWRLAAWLHRPVEQATPQDLEEVQAILRNRRLAEADRHGLEFIEALMRWRLRFDIMLEEVPRRIAAGKFDIEIEG